jgi:hypothetical protein
VPLKSKLFQSDLKLEAASRDNAAHIVPGATGEHVGKLQDALMLLEGVAIDPSEVKAKRYGASTANAVLAYKSKRDIVNRSYQRTADNIVGIMTMARLDQDIAALEATAREQSTRCDFGGSRRAPPIA